jgi:hypothetical protein
MFICLGFVWLLLWPLFHIRNVMLMSSRCCVGSWHGLKFTGASLYTVYLDKIFFQQQQSHCPPEEVINLFLTRFRVDKLDFRHPNRKSTLPHRIFYSALVSPWHDQGCLFHWCKSSGNASWLSIHSRIWLGIIKCWCRVSRWCLEWLFLLYRFSCAFMSRRWIDYASNKLCNKTSVTSNIFPPLDVQSRWTWTWAIWGWYHDICCRYTCACNDAVHIK